MMGDVGDDFRLFKEMDKQRKKRNLESANKDGWILHTEYHWSRTINGKRLDYWPSKNKFQYDGKVMCGDINGFIDKQRR